METTKLTIRLPRKHVEFAKAYAKAHGITVTEFIDRLLRRLQALEHTGLHPEVEAISGLVPPACGCRQRVSLTPHGKTSTLILVDLNVVLDVVPAAPAALCQLNGTAQRDCRSAQQL